VEEGGLRFKAQPWKAALFGARMRELTREKQNTAKALQQVIDVLRRDKVLSYY
jgi:hypothetical protein